MKPQIEQPLDCKFDWACFNKTMSTQAVKTKKDPEFLLDSDVRDFEVHDEITEKTPKERSPKVNINSLMDRVREEKKKREKRKSYFFRLNCFGCLDNWRNRVFLNLIFINPCCIKYFTRHF